MVKQIKIKQKTNLLVTVSALSTLLFIAIVFSGCSQKQKGQGVKTGSVTEVTGNSGKGANGAKAGSITDDGASSATEKGGNGSANFNYLPGNGSGNAGGYAKGYAKSDADITPAGLNDPNNLLSQRIIYFDYNQSTIRPEYMVLLNTHAKLLAKYPNLKVRLEGHADERGSREYNVALSEDRARSVKRLMGTQGARDYQMSILGYGEELPLVSGHGERSWQKNRRVEIKYKNY